MTPVVNKGQEKYSHSRVHELLTKIIIEEPNMINVKREKFLALLKNRYGYTNEVAINELRRLLKQFHTINRSLGIRRIRKNYEHPKAE